MDLKLSNYIYEKELRSFLLQNLNFNNGTYSWSLDLNTIKMGMKDLRGFPFDIISNTSQIDTLCIFGGDSPYINKNIKINLKLYLEILNFLKLKMQDIGYMLRNQKNLLR